MKKKHVLIESPDMGRKVHVWCYGFWGAPLLVFPSAAGFAHEWDAHGMVQTLAPLINGGKLKLYCPESNVSRTWNHKAGDAKERVAGHAAYESFITNTLVPWIRADCNSKSIPVATVGCSLGGYYAANFALKFPEIFHYALCMSGRYDLKAFAGGIPDRIAYFNNPLAYVPGLEGEALDKVRAHTHVTLVCGQGAFEEGCIEETVALGKMLQNKCIPNFIDIWGRESRHDWLWWKKQAVKHLSKTFG